MSRKIIGVTVGTPMNPEKFAGGGGGKDGVGIETINTIVEGSAPGFQNVYEIVLTDGRKYTFSTFNGRDGGDGSPPVITGQWETDDAVCVEFMQSGQPPYVLSIPKGKDGISPTVTVTETEAEITLTFTDVNGVQTVSIPKIPP